MTSYHSVNDSHSRTLLRHWAGGQPSNGSCNLQSIFASGIGIQDIKIYKAYGVHSVKDGKTWRFRHKQLPVLGIAGLAQTRWNRQNTDCKIIPFRFCWPTTTCHRSTNRKLRLHNCSRLFYAKKTCRHSHYILCCRSCCTGFSPITRPRRQECLPPSTHLAVKLQSLPSYHHGSVKNQHVRSWLSMPRAAFQKKRLVFSWTAIRSRCWWTVCLWYWNRHPSPLERNTCKLSKCLCLL